MGYRIATHCAKTQGRPGPTQMMPAFNDAHRAWYGKLTCTIRGQGHYKDAGTHHPTWIATSIGPLMHGPPRWHEKMLLVLIQGGVLCESR